MAKRKLSDVLKEHNIALEDIEDDELGMDLPSVRKGFKSHQAAATKASQERASLERNYQELAQNRQEWEAYANKIAREAEELKQAATQRATQVQQAGGNWRTDPLFQDIAADFNAHVNEFKTSQKNMEQSREAMSSIAKGVLGVWNYAQAQVQRVEKYLGEAEVERMRDRHTDFDEEKVREYAKAHNIPTWKGAYEGWKGSTSDSRIKEATESTRNETLREAEGRVNTPPTEVGSTRPAPSIESGNNDKREYNQRWGGLVDELKSAGIS
jgi:chromosome segregation ATPase